MSMLLIRPAVPEDVALIRNFITELAEYEQLLDDVVVSDDQLNDHLFVQHSASCMLCFEEEEPVGFAFYFFNYSTFLGKKGLYLEDLFVRPEFRGKGYGKKLLLFLVQTAQLEDCGRMEWSVLNWNQSAIDFYESLGAKAMKEWTVFRLTEEAMKQISDV